MLASVGQKVGARAKIETYTEVVLKKGGEKKHRPDGLIVVRSGGRSWSALVEAKVGNSDLTPEQVESYLELARLNGIDALVTLSNQFTSLPTHHPIALSSASRKKAEAYHWSWKYVVTQASLLISNEQVSDADQRIILNEMNRFLTHPSAGVKSFDQMPAVWSELVARVQAGGKISASASETKEVVGAWHQELRDLSLILSRKLSIDVDTYISRAHAADPAARLKAAIGDFAANESLDASLLVPDAAAPIDICCDLKKRTISVAMRLKAPADRKSTKARVSWMVRQLSKADAANLHLRLHWPGRSAHTQYPLAVLRDENTVVGTERVGLVPHSFEIILVKDIGGRFGQRKNFISELESAVPQFYEQVGQHVRGWVAPAPRIKEAAPSTIEDIEDLAESAAEHRDATG